MKITVLGSGSWGTALAVHLQKNGHDVTLWSFQKEEAEKIKANGEHVDFLPGVMIPPELQITTDYACVLNAALIVLAIPSKFMAATLKNFTPFIKSNQILVNVAKGLDEDRLVRLSQVIEEYFPENPVCVLSGPSHAEEVGKGLPTTCVAACEDIKIAAVVQDVFMNHTFRIYTLTDVVGVELGGALKNVIALAAGASDGMGYGDNTKAALMTRGIYEISQLGVAMGGKKETFAGLTGIGDLIVTCTSMHSRNRKAGYLMGQGKSLAEALAEVRMVVEGVNTAKAAYELSKKYNVNMPITQEIYQVLFEGKAARQAVTDLMMREKKTEDGAIDFYL